MFGNYYAVHKPATGQLALIIISGLIILPAFAYLVMVVYDTPVRNYLNRKRIGKDDSYSVIDDRAATNASNVIAAANDK